MLLGFGTLVFDDFFGEYLQPFENSLLNIITYIIIVLLPVSLSIYYRNKKWKNSFINEYNNVFNRCDYILYLFYVFCVGNEKREETKGEGVIGLQILLHKKPLKRKKETT